MEKSSATCLVVHVKKISRMAAKWTRPPDGTLPPCSSPLHGRLSRGPLSKCPPDTQSWALPISNQGLPAGPRGGRGEVAEGKGKIILVQRVSMWTFISFIFFDRTFKNRFPWAQRFGERWLKSTQVITRRNWSKGR